MKIIFKMAVFTLVFVLCCGCASEYAQRARQAEEGGDYAYAIAMWTEYLKRRPDDAAAYIDRGFDKSKIGDYAGAIDDYSSAIERDSANVLARFNRGVRRCHMADYAHAVEDFNAAVRIKGGDENGNLPAVYVEWVGNPFLDIEPDPFDVPYKDILFERGLAYYELDSLRSAFDDFSFCIGQSYKLEESHYYRGTIYHSYGFDKEAANDFKAVLWFGPRGSDSEFAIDAARRLKTLE